MDEIYNKYHFEYFLNTKSKIKHYSYYFHNNTDYIKGDICIDLGYLNMDINRYKIISKQLHEYVLVFNTNNIDTSDKESAIDEIYGWYIEYISNIQSILNNKTVVYQDDGCIFPNLLCKILTLNSIISCIHMG